MPEITGRNEKKKKRDEYFVPVAEQRARQEQEQEPGRWALGSWARGHAGRQAGARGRRHSVGAQGRAERRGARSAGARGAQGRAERRGARSAGARGAQGRAERRGARSAADAWADLRGARLGVRGTTDWAAWACCWANGLCTWCTQPVLARFDSVLFLSQFLDIIHEPGSWTLFIK